MPFNKNSWMKFAACKGVDINKFYPPAGERGRKQGVKIISRYCNVCPVQKKCLEVGRYNKFGIWGGMTAEQRKKMNQEKTH